MESRLYLVTDRFAVGGKSLLKLVKQALDAGVRIVQYREKPEKDRKYEYYESMAQAVQMLCRKYDDALFIVNDDIMLARKLNADGVHLGQEDKGCAEARPLLSAGTIIGVSVSSVDEAIAAQEAEADYVSVGPIFKTSTKRDAGKPVGVGLVAEIRRAVNVPVVAIGGINEQNIRDVVAAGADYIAMVSGILARPDIGAAVDCYHSLMNSSVNGQLRRSIGRRAYAAALSEST